MANEKWNGIERRKRDGWRKRSGSMDAVDRRKVDSTVTIEQGDRLTHRATDGSDVWGGPDGE